MTLVQTRSKKTPGISTIVTLGLKNVGINLQHQILQRCPEEKETMTSFVMTCWMQNHSDQQVLITVLNMSLWHYESMKTHAQDR